MAGAASHSSRATPPAVPESRVVAQREAWVVAQREAWVVAQREAWVGVGAGIRVKAGIDLIICGFLPSHNQEQRRHYAAQNSHRQRLPLLPGIEK